jgi:hypothetical protein
LQIFRLVSKNDDDDMPSTDAGSPTSKRLAMDKDVASSTPNTHKRKGVVVHCYFSDGDEPYKHVLYCVPAMHPKTNEALVTDQDLEDLLMLHFMDVDEAAWKTDAQIAEKAKGRLELPDSNRVIEERVERTMEYGRSYEYFWQKQLPEYERKLKKALESRDVQLDHYNKQVAANTKKLKDERQAARRILRKLVAPRKHANYGIVWDLPDYDTTHKIVGKWGRYAHGVVHNRDGTVPPPVIQCDSQYIFLERHYGPTSMPEWLVEEVKREKGEPVSEDEDQAEEEARDEENDHEEPTQLNEKKKGQQEPIDQDDNKPDE